MRIACALMASLLTAVASPVGQAGLIVTITPDVLTVPGDIDVNGTALVDVMLSSTTGTDVLGAYQVRFLIAPAAGVTSSLQFADPQTDDSGDPGYVFSGVSGGLTQAVSPAGLQDTLDVGDFDGTFAGVLLASPMLLARLDLRHLWAGDPSEAFGDGFSVRMDTDPNFSFFLDPLGDPLPIADTAVPEPHSIVLCGVMLLTGMAWRHRKRLAWHRVPGRIRG